MIIRTPYLCFMLTVLPVIVPGCTTPRQQLSNHDASPSLMQREDDPNDTHSSLASEPPSLVRTVAFQSDDVDGSIGGESSDQAVQFAVPVEDHDHEGHDH